MKVEAEFVSEVDEEEKHWCIEISLMEGSFTVSHHIETPWTDSYENWIRLCDQKQRSCNTLARFCDMWTIYSEKEMEMGSITTLHFNSSDFGEKLRKVIQKAKNEGYEFRN
jgi:hypothetical protein